MEGAAPSAPRIAHGGDSAPPSSPHFITPGFGFFLLATRHLLLATLRPLPPMSDAKLTPMMQQYFEVTRQFFFQAFPAISGRLSQSELPLFKCWTSHFHALKSAPLYVKTCIR